jgi:hypothetical protein
MKRKGRHATVKRTLIATNIGVAGHISLYGKRNK